MQQSVSAQGLKSSSFKSLLVAQFFGAANDNFYKVLVTLIFVNQMTSGQDEVYKAIFSGVCFVLPFLLFSPLAGSCADKFSKATVMRSAKLLEIIAMIGGGICLLGGYSWGSFVVLFVLGAHTAFFSPCKYGVLPEVLTPSELARGNGYVELVTFVACIFGTALGGILRKLFPDTYWPSSITLLAFALVGLLATMLIKTPAAARPEAELMRNPLSVFSVLRQIRQTPNLLSVLFALGYFWAIAALTQTNILIYAKELAGYDDFWSSILLAVMGIGIGGGSVLAGRVSDAKVELGLVPLGCLLMALGNLTLALSVHFFSLTLFGVLCLGMGGGIFVVPLNSYFQHHCPASIRGSAIAASNSVAYFGMLLAYGFLFLCLNSLGLNSAELLFIVSLSSLLLAVCLVVVMPEMLLRCINWLLTSVLYRLRIRGLENLPQDGGALIVCNHVAYVDPLLILAASKRPVRFLMYRSLYKNSWVNPIARCMGAIPIAFDDQPKELLKSLDVAREALRNGELVCVFAEGELTRIGRLLGFKKGYQRIVRDLDVPVIPAYIDQIWGSIFSHRGGKLFWKLPREVPYPVTMAFGKPFQGEVAAHVLRDRILELSAELASARESKYNNLPSAFLHSVRRRLFARCVADSSGRSLSYLSTLALSMALARRLRKKLSGEKNVAILLPPSVAAAVCNIAVQILGRVSVNLNFTAGADSLALAMARAGAKDTLSSRNFTERLGLAEPQGFLSVEELLNISKLQLAWEMFLILLLPQPFYRRLFLPQSLGRADLATIIFSSGSTGEPKGVCLTQGNIMSNIESLFDVWQLERHDAVLGALPFFHALGFTATLWLPLLSGIRVVYHSNPMEAATIGELVEKHQLSILLSTPTFLLGYLRKCTPAQFSSLKHVVVGAEKLKANLAESFQEKFGLLPLEGYGCTELSPVAMINVQNYTKAQFRQIGHKLGTVGQALPGVAVRIVEPDSGELLEPGKEGLLLIKGPNVMAGYLANPEKTAEVIRDGWYVTGDIAVQDEDGFISITDRLSRFSKIAGEMVPHIKLEEAITELLVSLSGDSLATCAVTALPDEKKGEKLFVLHTVSCEVLQVIKGLGERGLPNLWIPKPDCFFFVEKLPQLGSGKLDLKGLKEIVRAQLQQS